MCRSEDVLIGYQIAPAVEQIMAVESLLEHQDGRPGITVGFGNIPAVNPIRGIQTARTGFREIEGNWNSIYTFLSIYQ